MTRGSLLMGVQDECGQPIFRTKNRKMRKFVRIFDLEQDAYGVPRTEHDELTIALDQVPSAPSYLSLEGIASNLGLDPMKRAPYDAAVTYRLRGKHL